MMFVHAERVVLFFCTLLSSCWLLSVEHINEEMLSQLPPHWEGWVDQCLKDILEASEPSLSLNKSQEQLSFASDRKALSFKKKSHSLMTLKDRIIKIMKAHQDKQFTLQDIREALHSQDPIRYSHSTSAWKNSLRHTLTVNRDIFRRIPRQKGDKGKGGYWSLA